MTILKRIIFLGSYVPAHVYRRNIEYNVAANNFQHHLLLGLRSASDQIQRIEVASLLPVPSFPQASQLWVWGRRHQISPKIELNLVPFVNRGPIKVLTSMLGFWTHLTHRLDSTDLILTYNLNPSLALPALALGRRSRTPVVSIIADLPMPGSLTPRTMLRRLDAWLQKWMMKRVDGSIVLSTSVIRDFTIQKPYLRMEGGIPEDLATFSADSRFHVSPRGQELKVLYSGSLSVRGGLPLLLDSFALIKDPKCNLWVCGRGDLTSKVLEACARDPRIRYYGYVERPEYLGLLNSATLLVNPRPSYPENRYSFPSKLLEYLATGIPVITTATNGVLDEYGDKAFILNEETPEALANLIQKVGNSPSDKLDALGARARDYVLQHKMWNTQAERVFRFLEQIVDIHLRTYDSDS